MPRSLTIAQRRTLDSRRSGDPYLALLTFTHPASSKPIRVVKNAEDIVSQGYTFSRGWFEVEFPADKNEAPSGKLTVPNIDRAFSAILLALRSPPRVRLQAVLASDPNAVIEDYNFLYLRGITGDATSISGTLDSWDFTTEPWPAISGTAARFPGLWK